MLISALFMDLVFPLLPAYNGSPLLAALFSGILAGAGLASVSYTHLDVYKRQAHKKEKNCPDDRKYN